MSKIRIKYFGPIKEGLLENGGWLDISKITVFTGNQGSGKSTIAKLLSTFLWLEKSLNRGDFQNNQLIPHEFIYKHLAFHGLEHYLSNRSELEYMGSMYNISFHRKGNNLNIDKQNNPSYAVPKIMYIPAERIVLTTISDVFSFKGLPKNLFDLAEEYKKAQKHLTPKKLDLPINNLTYEYDESQDTTFIGNKDHKINLLQAASGFQSSIPLYIVIRHLTNLISNKNTPISDLISVTQKIRMNEEIASVSLDKGLSEKTKQLHIKKIQHKFINQCLISIVEEPELNLHPDSQKTMLYKLLAFANDPRRTKNKLILTTHSPYIINYLTLAVKAHHLKNKFVHERLSDSQSNKSELNSIIPLASTIRELDLSIYELNSKNGTISKLKTYNGLPTDANILNNQLAYGNELFGKLLDIEANAN
jgi:predicted ATPase